MVPRELPWTNEVRLAGAARGRVMLLSGFGSGPETLRPLGEALRETLGATVLLTALARHTGDPATFARSRAWHYVGEAEARFLAFAEERDEPLVLGGYSTGALVALVLAARHPSRVAGLVLASPALRLSRTDRTLVAYTAGSLYYVGLPLALLGGLAAIALRGRRRGWRHRHALGAAGLAAVAAAAAAGLRAVTVPLREGGPIRTAAGEEVLPPHFTHASLLTGSSLLPLQLVARWRLRRTTLPVCLVFGELDDVVDVRFGTVRAARAAQGEFHVVPDAPHRVVTSAGCHTAVAGFARRVLASPGAESEGAAAAGSPVPAPA
jgi:pimeloyl-ACP methyl ester carboxylesterase